MSGTRPIGLIVSVADEGSLIADRLKPDPKAPPGVPGVQKGIIGSVPLVYSPSGLGKTNAAQCLTSLILNYSPSSIVLFGVGGAYPDSGLGVGDVAVATQEVYADEGVLLEDGFHPLEMIGIPLLKSGRRKYFNQFPLDASLSRKMVRAARSIGLRVEAGIFATVSACTGTRQRADELSRRFGAICENMEGAAVAHICRLYRLRCVEVRGISNIVEARDASKWDVAKASENCQRTVLEFFKGLGSP
jgi:futalosine hydrolase